MNNKIIWYDARNLKDERKTLDMVFHHAFRHLVISFKMLGRVKPQVDMEIMIEIEKVEEIQEIKNINGMVILSKNMKVLEYAKEKGYQTACLKSIMSKEDMEIAWTDGLKFNYLIVEFRETTNIPLELILARTQNKKTSVIKKVRTLEEGKICFGVMESGSDGILFCSEDVDEIMKVSDFIMEQKTEKLDLVHAKVVQVSHIGMGKRVCIDTVDLLQNNEGMLVGSTSNGGILVSSETHYLPYMDLRPFRVNAGAIHSYVWGADGMTPYLSDIKAGSKLLCVDTAGNAREVTVGRAKIETRPLLMIRAEAKENSLNVILQDDWHIRIFGVDGKAKNASEIKPGDELLAYLCKSGRHVGIKINESLEER